MTYTVRTKANVASSRGDSPAEVRTAVAMNRPVFIGRVVADASCNEPPRIRTGGRENESGESSIDDNVSVLIQKMNRKIHPASRLKPCRRTSLRVMPRSAP